MPVSREDAERAREAGRRSWAESEDNAPEEGNANGHAPGPPPFTLLRDLVPDLGRRWLVKDLVPRAGLGCLYAPPGAGKTAATIDLALHLAAGREYRGRRVEPQAVVFAAFEGHGGITNRIVGAKQHLGISDSPFALVKLTGTLRDATTARLLADIARGLTGPGDNPLVIADTFQAALGGGGNDCRPEDVTELVEAVKTEIIDAGMTALLLHHTGKDASRGARGWSGLLAALDFELELDRDGDLRTMTVTKLRDGVDSQPPSCFRLDQRHLGSDPDGDPVTTVVVTHLADAGQGKGRRLTPNARAALECLWALIRDSKRSFPLDGGPLRCASMTEWRKTCLEPGIVSRTKDVRYRRPKVRAAFEELITSGAVIFDPQDPDDTGGGEERGRVYPAPKEGKNQCDRGATSRLKDVPNTLRHVYIVIHRLVPDVPACASH